MNMLFSQPAAGWHETQILGNGRIGAAVFGGTDIEEIDLNEDNLWSGYPYPTQAKMPEGYLEHTRDLVKEEKYGEATKYIAQIASTSDNTQMFVPFGNLYLEMLTKGEISNYRRVLDMETAEITISYESGRNQICRKCFISAVDQMLMYQIESKEPISVRIWSENGYLTEGIYEQNKIRSIGRCPGRNRFRNIDPEAMKVPTFVTDNEAEMGMAYEGRGIVDSPDGSVESTEAGVIVKNATTITLYYAIRSSFSGFDKHPVLEGANVDELLEQDLKICNLSYEQIRERHLVEYQSYYNRVTLELSSGISEASDVKERLYAMEEGVEDCGMEAMLFNYGRYLLISCSRPETQPANLQGIWNKERKPPWYSNYTININTEMNYWMTGPCNLAEMGEPLKRMCVEMLEDGKKTAKAYFGVEGACSFHNVDIWRKTTPASGKPKWIFWPCGYMWLCRNLFDQYLFTQDKEYLAEIYPVLRENVIFALQIVTKTEKGYALTPVTSPENDFKHNGEIAEVAYYAENSNGLIRNLLRDYLRCCADLHKEDELSKEAAELLEQMVPVEVGSLGQILEWDKEYEEVDPQHRHLSHLYELHPGDGIGRNTPELYKAAEVSLERRGGRKTGWSLAWKMSMWARVHRGNGVGEIMKTLFTVIDPDNPRTDTEGGVYANLLCAHPPYQIDGNLGYTAGVIEMLLQSHKEELEILPAIPDRWKVGKVSGIRARGGITVDIKWDETLIVVTLKSDKNQTVNMRINNMVTKNIELIKGQEMIFKEFL